MGGELPDEMIVAIVCEKIGWTYQEYASQPDWLISTLLIKWNEEAKHQNSQKV